MSCVPIESLTTMGETGDGDIAVSPPPPAAGQGQNVALPCSGPQFSPKTRMPQPLSPLGTDFPWSRRGSSRESESLATKKAKTKQSNKPQSQRTRVGKQHPAPSRKGASLPARIVLIREGFTPKQRGQKAGEADGGGTDRAPEEFAQDGTN